MRVVCYYRHSTDNAQQDANSIPRQRDNCRGLIVRNGWRMIDEVEDKGLSGTGDKKNLSLLAQRTRNNDIAFDVFKDLVFALAIVNHTQFRVGFSHNICRPLPAFRAFFPGFLTSL